MASREQKIPFEYVTPTPQYQDNIKKNEMRDQIMLLGRCTNCGFLRRNCGGCDRIINLNANDDEREERVEKAKDTESNVDDVTDRVHKENVSVISEDTNELMKRVNAKRGKYDMFIKRNIEIFDVSALDEEEQDNNKHDSMTPHSVVSLLSDNDDGGDPIPDRLKSPRWNRGNDMSDVKRNAVLYSKRLKSSRVTIDSQTKSVPNVGFGGVKVAATHLNDYRDEISVRDKKIHRRQGTNDESAVKRNAVPDHKRFSSFRKTEHSRKQSVSNRIFFRESDDEDEKSARDNNIHQSKTGNDTRSTKRNKIRVHKHFSPSRLTKDGQTQSVPNVGPGGERLAETQMCDDQDDHLESDDNIHKMNAPLNNNTAKESSIRKSSGGTSDITVNKEIQTSTSNETGMEVQTASRSSNNDNEETSKHSQPRLLLPHHKPSIIIDDTTMADTTNSIESTRTETERKNDVSHDIHGIDDHFIQPEGDDIATELPNDVVVVDLTTSIKYVDLPHFFDSLADRMESEKVVDAKVQLAILKRKIRKDDNSGDWEMESLDWEMESLSLFESIRDELIHKGTDQCRLSLQRLHEKKKFRAYRNVIPDDKKKEFSRRKMEWRDLRMKNLNEMVEDVIRDTRRITDGLIIQRKNRESRGENTVVGNENGNIGSVVDSEQGNSIPFDNIRRHSTDISALEDGSFDSSCRAVVASVMTMEQHTPSSNILFVPAGNCGVHSSPMRPRGLICDRTSTALVTAVEQSTDQPDSSTSSPVDQTRQYAFSCYFAKFKRRMDFLLILLLIAAIVIIILISWYGSFGIQNGILKAIVLPPIDIDGTTSPSISPSSNNATFNRDEQTSFPKLISIATNAPSDIVSTSFPSASFTSTPTSFPSASFTSTPTPISTLGVSSPIITTGNISLIQLVGSPVYGSQQDSKFGYSISLSINANRLAIGTPLFDSPKGLESGSVTVHSSKDSVKKNLLDRVGYQLYGETAKERFGWRTCISSDGQILAVSGGLSKRRREYHYVKVYKYSDTEKKWVQRGQTLHGDDGAVSTFGFGLSLSLSHYGSRLAVGSQTSAFLFEYDSFLGQWTAMGGRANGGEIQEYYKSQHVDVALSDNGMRLAVGGAYHNESTGRVRVFDVLENTSDGNVYRQVGQTLVGRRMNDRWGYSLSLSGNGTVVASGCFNGGNYVKAYTLEQDGNKQEWIPLGKEEDLVGNAMDNNLFGFSVSLSSGGDLLLVGSLYYKDYGRTVLYRVDREASTWRQIGQVDGLNDNDQEGFAVSMSPDGGYFATVAINGDGGAIDSGLVRVFKIIDRNGIRS